MFNFSNTIETVQIVVEVDQELLKTQDTEMQDAIFNIYTSVNWTVISENRRWCE